jgi:hypothetical protein
MTPRAWLVVQFAAYVAQAVAWLALAVYLVYGLVKDRRERSRNND